MSTLHPLVAQLHFTRTEWKRALDGVGADEALRRFGPMNSISWMIGHLANQEHFYWIRIAQGKNLFPELNNLVGSGKPASAPPMDEMWHTWNTIVAASDVFLKALDSAALQNTLIYDGKPVRETTGTMLQRNIYHYWFHLGESYAVRQLLGHVELPSFVGDMTDAIYHPH